jgi:hypothetical protein
LSSTARAGSCGACAWLSTTDASRDEKVYRCDAHVAGPCASLGQAVEALLAARPSTLCDPFLDELGALREVARAAERATAAQGSLGASIAISNVEIALRMLKRLTREEAGADVVHPCTKDA